MSTHEIQTIPWGRVLRNQIGLLWKSRAAWIVIGLALSVFGYLEFEAIRREALWMAREQPGGFRSFLYTPGIWEIHGVTGLVLPLLWVALVWRGEPFDRRRYHWSLPVIRTGHDLARFAAGAFWLMVAIAVVEIAALSFYAVAGRASAFQIGVAYWISLFTVALLTYTAASVLPIATRRPLGWAVWFVGAGTVLIHLLPDYGTAPNLETLALDLSAGPWGPDPAWVGAHRVEYPAWRNRMAPDRPPMNWGGDLRFWVQATLLWLAISASGVLLAVRRRA